MRIWEPCPECGACPWRPLHAVEKHGALIETLADLRAWADAVAS